MESSHRRSDAQANRERLIQAAGELVAERGMDVEMKEIAERAGVGVGTIYRNFPTKEALIDALIDRLDEELMQTREALMAEDPVGALQSFFDLVFDVIDRYGPLFEARISELKHRQQQSERHLASRDEILRLLSSAIERGVMSGQFRADIDRPVTAHIMVMQALSYLELRRIHGAAQLRAAILEFVLRGLGVTSADVEARAEPERG